MGNLLLAKARVLNDRQKVKVGNGLEIEQSERNSHSKNRGGKTNLQSGTYTKKIDRKPSEQLFPNMRPLSYPNLT